jgi:hypothetical protein
LIVLLGGFALANVFEMGGRWFSVFEVVLMAGAFLLGALALCTGLGAVILSRGGSQGAYADGPWGLSEDELASERAGHDV